MNTRKLLARSSALLTPLVLATTLVFLSGCGGGGSGLSTTQSQLGTINGTVSTTQNLPLVGATVTAGGVSTTTDEAGRFSLKELAPKEELALRVSLNNYWPLDKQIALPSGVTTDVNVQLAETVLSGSFDSAVGGLYEVGLTSITLPANGYVIASSKESYTGNVTILSRYYNVQNGDASIFPNSYRIKKADETETLLQTHGAQGILLLGDQGEPLDLAAGSSIIIELPASRFLPLDQEMKMWHYNTATGIWEFVDNAVFKSDRYRAVLPTTGLVSLGIASPATGTVTGCVVNPNNEPQRHANVEVIGSSWIANDLNTDDLGKFTLTAPADELFFVRASKNGTQNGLQGEFIITEGEVLELQECMVLTSPRAKFTVTWGAEPRDLDAHLVFTRGFVDDTATDGEGSTPLPSNEIFFGSPFIDNVFLSQESATGNGTEIIDIQSLTDGTYTFSVSHFDGASDISASGAVATLDIGGQGVRTLSAPLAGAKGVKDVWTVWTVTVKSGAITIAEVNSIAQNPASKSSGQIDFSVKGVIQN